MKYFFSFIFSASIIVSCNSIGQNHTAKGLDQNEMNIIADTLMWLRGEDGGSWFKISSIDKESNEYRIDRYFEDKTPYSSAVFIPDANFTISKPYTIVPICNSEVCHIKQGNRVIKFTKIQ
jgi:hypothetical protein